MIKTFRLLSEQSEDLENKLTSALDNLDNKVYTIYQDYIKRLYAGLAEIKIYSDLLEKEFIKKSINSVTSSKDTLLGERTRPIFNKPSTNTSCELCRVYKENNNCMSSSKCSRCSVYLDKLNSDKLNLSQILSILSVGTYIVIGNSEDAGDYYWPTIEDNKWYYSGRVSDLDVNTIHPVMLKRKVGFISEINGKDCAGIRILLKYDGRPNFNINGTSTGRLKSNESNKSAKPKGE